MVPFTGNRGRAGNRAYVPEQEGTQQISQRATGFNSVRPLHAHCMCVCVLVCVRDCLLACTHKWSKAIYE